MKKLLLLVPFLFVLANANAQWNTDTLLRTAICTYVEGALDPHICKDDSGGYFIFYRLETASACYIYAQRVTNSGYVMWPAPGQQIATTCGSTSTNMNCFPDGAGGVVIVYNRPQPGTEQIRGQRIDRNGNKMWGTLGVLIGGNQPFTTYQDLHAAQVEDGNVIAVWDAIPGPLEAQKIDTSGNKLWGTNAVTIDAAADYPLITSNGRGGAYIGFAKGTPDSISVMQVESNGVLSWANRVKVFPDAGTSFYDQCTISPDGNNGVFLSQARTYEGVFIYHINTNGNVFPSTGTLVASMVEKVVSTVSNVPGQVIVSFSKPNYTFTSSIIISAKVDSLGTYFWGNNGVISCTDTSKKEILTIAPDSSGGAYLAWADKRYTKYTYYGMHVSSGGNLLWRNNGWPVCAKLQENNYPEGLSIYGKPNSPVIAWEDTRATLQYSGIFATDVTDAPLEINKATPNFHFLIYPNPSREVFNLLFNGTVNKGLVEVFNLMGQKIYSEAILNEIEKEFALKNAAAGIYFVKVSDEERIYTQKLVIE